MFKMGYEIFSKNDAKIIPCFGSLRRRPISFGIWSATQATALVPRIKNSGSLS